MASGGRELGARGDQTNHESMLNPPSSIRATKPFPPSLSALTWQAPRAVSGQVGDLQRSCWVAWAPGPARRASRASEEHRRDWSRSRESLESQKVPLTCEGEGGRVCGERRGRGRVASAEHRREWSRSRESLESQKVPLTCEGEGTES
jgi:hypothetical protein